MAVSPHSQATTATRTALRDDLLDMSAVLKQRPDFCRNPEVLDNAATQLANPGIAGQDSWHYTFEDLYFAVKKPPGTSPANIYERLLVSLSVRATGASSRPSIDPFHDLSVNLWLRPDYKPQEAKREAWHFDRHRTTGNAVPMPSDYAHPLYHLEHGGFELSNLGQKLGDYMLVTGPRVGLPPMDAILAVDFIASNYSAKHWAELRNDPQYERLIRSAHSRFWAPYYGEVSLHLTGTNPSKAHLLEPTLF